jgi:hypothetical protein
MGVASLNREMLGKHVFVIYSTHSFNKEMICSRNDANHISASTLVSCSANSTLKMVGIYSSETLVDFERTTHRYVPEDSSLHNDGCENLKSYTTHLNTIFLNL